MVDTEPLSGAEERQRPPDRLLLQGLRFYGHHGVSAEERRSGGEFTVDLEFEVEGGTAMSSDDLATVNYVDVYQVVRTLVEEGEFRLIETLAATIAAAVLRLAHVSRVKVRVTKPPRLPGQLQGFAAEVVRTR
ncbi:MAG TPA: dihydroneopterin aldolase [Candidatus Dormibacteraeota bacterium]